MSAYGTTRRVFLKAVGIGCACAVLGPPVRAAAKESSLPNIIIIYADDLGYGDLSCYNAECAYKTPRLDRMAAEGIRFTDAHSPSTICSPSRYGLEKSTPLVDGPNARGFDESFVTPNCPTTDPLYIYIENGMVSVPASQRHKSSNLPNPGGKWRWDNDEGWMAPGYEFVKADLLFYEKTRRFITEHRKNSPEKPFFAVLSTQIAHAPVLPAPEFNGATKAGPRGDFVWELDVLVGRVLDLVDELGIDEDTLILFNADNGAETVHVDWMRQDHDHDPSGRWRGMKRDAWEGGHRVPFIARWPIRPHLLTQSFRGEFQIRQGKWKYLDHPGSGGNNYDRAPMKRYALAETAPGAPGQLFDLEKDPGETSNLYFTEQAKRRELKGLLERLKSSGRSAPRNRIPIGIENIPRIKE